MINYKGTPLFGPDSDAQHTSEFFAIAGTILFWLLFLIFSLVIKPQPKKQYKEVQIVLSSTPVVQKSEESPAPAEAAAAPSAAASQTEEAPVTPVVETPAPAPSPKSNPAPKPVEKKVETPAPKKTETPKPKAQQQKTETPKTTPAPVQKSEPVEQVLYQDPMEAFANQTKQQPKKEFDWSKLDGDEVETEDAKDNQRIVESQSTIEGAAGIATTTPNKNLTSTSSNDNSKTTTSSSATINKLQGIRNTFSGNAPSGIQSETNVKATTSGSGKVEMEMSNGRTRALLDPEKPVINIPPELYPLIDSSRTVTISFKVVDSGNVTDVQISPASSLHSSIRQEIIGQLLFWRFEPADYTATASFEYKIIKR